MPWGWQPRIGYSWRCYKSRTGETDVGDVQSPRARDRLRMGERRGEADEPRLLVDRRRLNGRDLVAPERLAYDVEAARECGIAKGLILIVRVRGANDRNQRLLRIGEFRLRL